MLSFLYVYSDHSILECYNLFSGVELSMRSFFVISVTWSNKGENLSNCWSNGEKLISFTTGNAKCSDRC